MAVALNKPYCTLAQLQAELRNDDSAEQDWLHECINRASRFLDEYCLRDYWFHDHSASPLRVKPEWVAGTLLVLPWPVLTLTAVTEDDVVMAAADYFADGHTIYRDGSWVVSPVTRTLTLTGTFGYALGAAAPATNVPTLLIPDGICRATILMAAAFSGLYNKQVTGKDGESQSILVTSIPKEAYTLMDRYRRRLL